MGSAEPVRRHIRVSSVAIIGAGPSGLAAAKYLIAEKAFSNITIFEQRSQIGGLWIHTPSSENASQALPVPQTDPNVDLGLSSRSADGQVISPVYDRLETNIPRGLMGFSDLAWPDDSQLFPGHHTVLDYIDEYGQEVKHLISFRTEVLSMQRTNSGWLIATRSVDTQEQTAHHFEAVIVASGHFDIPFIPEVTNVKEWHTRFPGWITHSKYYRRPEDFSGKKVVLIGNSASGVDIAAQIREYCKKPLIQSLRSESQFLPEPNANQVEKPPIVAFATDSRTITFADGSKEHDVDRVLYCTGYLYSFPFLKTLNPPVITTGERVNHLYKHVFYRPDPTLSFLVLNQKVIPFPVAEAQSAVVARVLSGRLPLPDEEEMRAWEEAALHSCAREKDFHVLKFPKDADYINELHDWAMSAIPPDQKAAVGKTPPRWDAEAYWTREKFPDIKKAFQALGEDRHKQRTLKDVGFDVAAQRSKVESASA